MLVSSVSVLVPFSLRAQEAGSSSARAEVPQAIVAAEQEAAQWIAVQMAPNDTVPSPDPGRRRLLLSYVVGYQIQPQPTTNYGVENLLSLDWKF